MLRFKSLGSGSAGNATLVEARCGADARPTRLLVDCGLRPSRLEAQLGANGLTLDDLDAVFITHEHSDHVGGLDSLCRQWSGPVWMSHGTWQGSREPALGQRLNKARDLQPIHIGALDILPFTVPHDAREPLQLRLSDGAVSLGILTDLGHASGHVLSALQQCDALLLECNHDPDLLAASTYPAFLKRRIGGPLGHLSNAEAAALARRLQHPGLRHLVAAHLSSQNNHPDLVRQALSQALDCTPPEVLIATAAQGTPWLNV